MVDQKESTIPFVIEERYDLGSLVTFIPNKKVPIHNWFYFKEGFSRDFVLLMLDWLKVKSKDLILDPFCGSGTTLLASKEAGINAIGVDASPLAVFVTQVKTEDYDLDRIRDHARELFSKKFKKYEIKGLSPLTKRAFSRYSLEDIIFFKEEIKSIDDPKIRNFFTLALMNSANKVTYAYKDGSVIKIREKPSIPLKKVFKRIVKRMIHDLKKVNYKGSEIKVYLGDARKMDFLPENYFDAVITSPPYLNKIEYTKVYSIEYELFFEDIKFDSLRSYIGLNPKHAKDLFPELNLPDVAKAYLQDMNDSLKEIYRVMKDDGKCSMVVAEGVFPDRIVPVDLLMANLAERIGFKVKKIVVANRRVVTRDRTLRIGRARESIVTMRK
ncbi:MAG: DNA methyltransferase [Nitrososphaerales archaeon]